MAKLKTEYTDIKDVKHQVMHQTVTDDDKRNREQLLTELYIALTKNDKRIST